jgi:hypothetical protein
MYRISEKKVTNQAMLKPLFYFLAQYSIFWSAVRVISETKVDGEPVFTKNGVHNLRDLYSIDTHAISRR